MFLHGRFPRYIGIVQKFYVSPFVFQTGDCLHCLFWGITIPSPFSKNTNAFSQLPRQLWVDATLCSKFDKTGLFPGRQKCAYMTAALLIMFPNYQGREPPIFAPNTSFVLTYYFLFARMSRKKTQSAAPFRYKAPPQARHPRLRLLK